MAEISEKEIRDVADLALLTLTDNEVEMYQKDLSAVLGYFEKLAKVDTDAVEQIGHITGMQDIYRNDEAVEISEENREAFMKNVPSRDGNYISVKNVL